MDRQNLIQRLVARKLQPANKGKAFLCATRANGKALCGSRAQPKK